MMMADHTAHGISLQGLAAALGGEVSTGQVLAPGPGHSPADRSLSVKLDCAAPDGFVTHSFAGDDAIDCRDHVRNKLGLPVFKPNGKGGGHLSLGKEIAMAMAELRKSQPETPAAAREWVCNYDYRDLDGTLLYQVQRFDSPKAFIQRKPAEGGGWIYKGVFEGVARVLYRWADLAKYPDGNVFICEGEKDADNVAALGLCATTTAGSVWTVDCTAPLTGRDVFVLVDNDVAGFKKAEAAALALHGVAASVRMVLLPDLADKGDVSDWLDAGHKSDELVSICVAAPEWRPRNTEEKPATGNAVLDAVPGTAPTGIVATPYVWKDPTKIPPRDWLYGFTLIREFVTATVSPGAFGKSSLIVVDVLAMISGKNLIGISPKGKLRVWLWNLEDPQEETERKIQAAALHYRLSPDDIGDRLFVDSGRDQPLVIATTTRTGTMIVAPVVDALVAEIIARKIDVLVIDPFVSCHEVPENDNTSMDMIVKEWGKVADRGNCAVHLVDHTRKMGSSETEVTVESSRGGKAKTDACRGVRVVNRMTKDEGGKVGIENYRLYFRTYDDKPNLAPPADKSDWFKLVSVDLGNGTPSYPGDSVGVVTQWEWPDPLAGMTVADFDKVAATIKRGKWRENSQAKAWAGKAVAEALDLDVEDKANKATILGMLKVWLAAGSLVVVEGLDENREIRKFIEVKEKD
jgi:AAA domain